MSTYSTCLGIALFLGWFLWTRAALAQGWIRSPLSPVAPAAALLGIVGAKVLAAVGEWEAYGDSLLRWRGPLAVQGGMLATGFFLALWAALARRPVLSVLDAHVRAFAVVLIPIRIGCLGAGCCYGSPTDGAFGVVGEDGLLRHPTQIYEIGLALVLIALLDGVPFVRAAAGRRLFAFAIVYGLGRAAIELVREDTRPVVLSVTYPQIVGACMALLGIAGMVRSLRRARGALPPAPPVELVEPGEIRSRAPHELRGPPPGPSSALAPRPRSRLRSTRLNGSASLPRSLPTPHRSTRPENQEPS